MKQHHISVDATFFNVDFPLEISQHIKKAPHIVFSY